MTDPLRVPLDHPVPPLTEADLIAGLRPEDVGRMMFQAASDPAHQHTFACLGLAQYAESEARYRTEVHAAALMRQLIEADSDDKADVAVQLAEDYIARVEHKRRKP